MAIDAPQPIEGPAAATDELLASFRRDLRRRSLVRTVRRLALLGVVIVAWQLFGLTQSPIFFPTFTATIGSFVDLLASGELATALFQSLRAMLLGYGLAVVVGVTGGLVMGRYRAIDNVAQMYATALLAVPMVAIFPFVVVVFGLSFSAEVFIVFFFVVIYIAITTAAGVRTVSWELLEMGRSFMLSEGKLFRSVILPSAAPLIMAGIRLGFGRAVTGMLLAELLLVGSGLGFRMNEAAGRYNTSQVFAVVLTVVLLAIVGVGLIQRLDRRINAWYAP